MLSASITSLRKQITRRIITSMMLVTYLSLAIGFPFPQFVKKSGEYFPCQHHRCGCSTLNQFWTTCCCFSLDERIAWAKRENQPIPATVLVEWELQQSEINSCCKTTANNSSKISCCAKQTACCEKSVPNTSSTQDSSANSHDQQNSIEITLLINAHRCAGYADTWLSLGAVLVGETFAAMSPELLPFEKTYEYVSHLTSVIISPLTPPPKTVLSA